MLTIGLTNVIDGHHDNSVAAAVDGRIVFAASEERFTRAKHDGSFPRLALAAALRHVGADLADVDRFAVGWTPASFRSGLFGASAAAPFRTAASVFARTPGATIRYLKRSLPDNVFRRRRENALAEMGVAPERLVRLGHYECHVASAYRTSGLDEALGLCIDAMGTDVDGNLLAGAAYHCRGGEIRLLETIPLHASLGLFYSAVTVLLGFRFLDGEWKTMGLAAYGDPSRCLEDLRPLAPTFAGGEWRTFPRWTDYRIVEDASLLRATESGARITALIAAHGKEHVAAAAQRLYEEAANAYVSHLLSRCPAGDIVAAGGCLLNVKANQKVLALPGVRSLFIHPAAGDAGIAVGAALEAHHLAGGKLVSERMESAALGTSATPDEVRAAIAKFGGRVRSRPLGDVAAGAADELVAGRVLGWFHGRAEWGPRALGHRSVVADPRSPTVRERINSTLKNRDWFMPFAPSVIEERASEYFIDVRESPFMTLAFGVVPGKEAEIPAAVHVDRTARVHTVRRSVNPRYHALISAFAERTGVPVVLNTSFNRHGLPIVDTPEDAIEHLVWGCVDALVLEDHLVERTGPPAPPAAAPAAIHPDDV